MIMKANKQIGFIYKNEESIDKILKDGDVVFERGFLRERTSTTLPITFGGVGKDLKDYRVYGNTYQNSTSGKNLNIYPYNGHTLANGITFTSNADGTLIIDGQNDNNGNSAFYFFSNSSNPRILEAGTYYFIPPSNTHVQYVIYDGINYYTFNSNNNYHRTFQTSISAKVMYIQVSKGSTAIFNGLKVYPMLSTTVVTESDWEPYTGGQPSPNPDYLQEIVSCGDRTKNLFLTPDTPSQSNLPTYSKINNNSFTLYYNQTSTTARSPYVRIDFDITKFKPNTRYTISKKYTVSGDNFNNVGAIRSYINGANGSVVNSNSFSFTTPSEISSLGVYFYLGYENRTVGESQITFYDIQIEENSSATPYEPYGYKIPVNVRSENLFDKDNANVLSAYFGISDNKDVITSASTNRMIYIPCKPNTTYTILKSLSNQFSIGYTYVQPTIGVQVYGIVEGTMNDGTKSWTGQDDINAIVHLSITTNENAKYLVLRYTNINNDKNSTWQEKLNVIQIVEGSTTPDKYIPYYNETTNIYLDEPLRKIDEYSDYIDFINQKIVRNIDEIVLDGSEDWTTIQAYGRNYYAVAISNLLISNSGSNDALLYNNYYIGYKSNELVGNNTKDYGICRRNNNSQVLFRDKDQSILSDLTTWLSTHNNIMCYPLATPTEESITLPNIPTIDGNNTLNIETEITPSQVYIKYKSNT